MIAANVWINKDQSKRRTRSVGIITTGRQRRKAIEYNGRRVDDRRNNVNEIGVYELRDTID